MTTIFTIDSTQPVGLGAMTGSAGPRHCAVCGEWPARQTERGNRCHLCESREWCAEHPVPLPSNRKMLEDLANIGVPGAAEKLRQNTLIQRQNDTMKTHVIYHRKDADGILSAAIVCHAKGLNPNNSILYPVDYPEPCPLLLHFETNNPVLDFSKVAEHDQIIIVDYSYSHLEMLALCINSKVTLYDHHETALQEYSKLIPLIYDITPNHPLQETWILDKTRAACQIVWDELIGTPRPWWLDLIGWRDLGGPWQPNADSNKTHDANILNTALFSFAPLDPYRLAQHVPSGTAWQTWFDQGEALCHANQAAAQAIAAAVPLTLAHFPDAVGTLKLPIVFNCHPALTSDVCHHLMKIHNWPTACVCSRSSEAPYSFTFSFRSRPGGPDVAALAKRHGGGGHPQAAGCTLPSLPPLSH